MHRVWLTGPPAPLVPVTLPALSRTPPPSHTNSRPQIPPTLGEEDEGVEGTIGSRDAQGLGALAGNPAFGQFPPPSPRPIE